MIFETGMFWLVIWTREDWSKNESSEEDNYIKSYVGEGYVGERSITKMSSMGIYKPFASE